AGGSADRISRWEGGPVALGSARGHPQSAPSPSVGRPRRPLLRHLRPVDVPGEPLRLHRPRFRCTSRRLVGRARPNVAHTGRHLSRRDSNALTRTTLLRRRRRPDPTPRLHRRRVRPMGQVRSLLVRPPRLRRARRTEKTARLPPTQRPPCAAPSPPRLDRRQRSHTPRPDRGAVDPTLVLTRSCDTRDYPIASLEVAHPSERQIGRPPPVCRSVITRI